MPQYSLFLFLFAIYITVNSYLPQFGIYLLVVYLPQQFVFIFINVSAQTKSISITVRCANLQKKELKKPANPVQLLLHPVQEQRNFRSHC